jgi:hypothetical protein
MVLWRMVQGLRCCSTIFWRVLKICIIFWRRQLTAETRTRIYRLFSRPLLVLLRWMNIEVWVVFDVVLFCSGSGYALSIFHTKLSDVFMCARTAMVRMCWENESLLTCLGVLWRHERVRVAQPASANGARLLSLWPCVYKNLMFRVLSNSVRPSVLRMLGPSVCRIDILL